MRKRFFCWNLDTLFATCFLLMIFFLLQIVNEKTPQMIILTECPAMMKFQTMRAIYTKIN